MTDIPLPWNGGGFLAALILAALVLMAALHPLSYRCRHCGGRYPTEGDLLAHLTDVNAARERHPALEEL